MHLQIVCTQIIFYKYSTVRDIYIFFWFKVKRAIRRDLLMIASLYISHTTQDVTAALGNNRVKQGFMLPSIQKILFNYLIRAESI
jgi:hypothetical protein